jgi:hypothetical protein
MAQHEEFRDFIQNIIVEVLLKSLKNGKAS